MRFWGCCPARGEDGGVHFPCPPPSPRCLEALLRAGRGPCVLADTAELPTLADIQLAHLKLWALCLHGERGTGTLGFPRAHSGVLGFGGDIPKLLALP